MKDETGVPGAPFVGKRGPRKTRPKKKSSEELAGDAAAVVTELFTEERRARPARKGRDAKPVKRKKIVIGRTWSAAIEDMQREGMTMEEFVQGLTPEELARGRLRLPDGTFGGRPPNWVPTEFHKECIRELMRRGKVLYQENYIQAINSMTMLANNPLVEPKDRIKAAQFVIERIEGKVPEKLEIGVSEPWQEILTGIVATVDPSALPMRPLHEKDDTSE